MPSLLQDITWCYMALTEYTLFLKQCNMVIMETLYCQLAGDNLCEIYEINGQQAR